MGRTGSRLTGSFFVIDYPAPSLPLASLSISFLPATDSSAPSLRHRPSFCVSFSPFHSPLRRDYVRPSRFPSPPSSRLVSSLLASSHAG